MAALTDLLLDVLPEVPGCTEPLAVNALRHTAIRLCSFAAVWVVKGEFAVVNGVAEYDIVAKLVIPSTADIVRVMSPVYVNGGERRVFPSPRSRLDYISDTWLSQAGPQVETFFMSSPQVLRVVPTPNIANTDLLTVRAWLRPKDGTTEIDDALMREYRAAIADGAKARLMAMAGQEWSSPAQAIYYGREFNRGLVSAYARASKDYTEADLAVRMRPLA